MIDLQISHINWLTQTCRLMNNQHLSDPDRWLLFDLPCCSLFQQSQRYWVHLCEHDSNGPDVRPALQVHFEDCLRVMSPELLLISLLEKR